MEGLEATSIGQSGGDAGGGMKRKWLMGAAWWLGFSLITAAAPGDLDPDFDPNVTNTATGTPFVGASAIQPDGKIVIGGLNFNRVQGVVRNNIARIGPDGLLDPDFDPNANSQVACAAVLDNGNILIGGAFTSIGGVTHNRLALLSPGGALIQSFNPAPNGAVTALAVLPDGRLLVFGSFTSIGGQSRFGVARLLADGTVDTDFNAGGTTVVTVYSAAVQDDGKIVIGGSFSSFGGATRNNITRLLPNGATDPDFTATANDQIRTVNIQPDGRILIGGKFTEVNGQSRSKIARLLPATGALDDDFVGSATLTDVGSSHEVASIILQTDAKILFSEAVFSPNVTTPSAITRLTGTGAVDGGFTNPGMNQLMSTLSLQTDGALVAAGRFTIVGGVTRNRVARLLNDPASAELSAPGPDTVRWLRGGSAPEAIRVGFELSTDGGETWQPLAGAARIAGGWEATGLDLPESGHLRARARTTGDGKGSSGLVETIAAFSFGPPNQPPVFAGFSAATGYQTPVSVFLSKILARASDPDGDAISITAAGPGSEGGSATLQTQTLEYTPPAGFSGVETVPITLTDERGASTEAFITLTVAEQIVSGQGSLATNPPRIQALPGGDIAVSFQGIPGRVYQIQRSTDLNDWQPLASVTASPAGLIEFTDEDPPTPSGYYRLAIP